MAVIINLPARCKASGIHLILSALVAVITAALVFGLWYPWPFRVLAGGQTLFLLLIAVDLILGPLLTFVVLSAGKPSSLLVRDLIVIVILQFAGLAYGVHTVYLARPVALVYEPGRFRVVANVDVADHELQEASPEVRTLSMNGPKLLGTRKPRSIEEQMQAAMIAIKGVDIGRRPSFWQPYKMSIVSVLNEARPISELMKQYPAGMQQIVQYLKEIGRDASTLKFVPIISRHENWSALIDANTGEVVGYVPYDGFF